MARGAVVLFDQPGGRELVAKHCRRIGLPVADLERLIEAVIDRNAMQRRRGLWGVFDEVLDTPVESADRSNVLGKN